MSFQLKVEYSKDEISKKDLFYEKYIRYQNKYHFKLTYEENLITRRKERFIIQLFYANELIFQTNKITSFPTILLYLKNPQRKKRIQSVNLYTDAHPETTISGFGFKDEKKALETIQKLKKYPRKYQYQVIQTMYSRAKYHPHSTKEMKEAEKIFKEWLMKYKKERKQKGGKSSKFPYLDLSIIDKYEKLADLYNISRKARGLEKPTTSDEGFLVVYRRVKGDWKKLKDIPCKKKNPDGIHWDRKRDLQVFAKYQQMKKMKIPLYNREGIYKDLPTVMHVNMIMWAYSPDEKGLKKRMSLLKKIGNMKK